MASDYDPVGRETDAIHEVRDGVLRLQNLLEFIRIGQARGEDGPDRDSDERLSSD